MKIVGLLCTIGYAIYTLIAAKAVVKQTGLQRKSHGFFQGLQRKTGLILPLITAFRFQKIELKTGLKNRIFAAK
ncbi:MAG: hypothetical protein EOO91_11380 [Pedobacter sp.]|nr:MAG: hypothetical protein EOO91_11380 [Pedobacter sp.]